VVETVGGRVQVVIGVGGNDTAKVVDDIRHTRFDSISGLLSQTPYYNKPVQAGLMEHFKVVAAVSPVPVILYNVPSRTGVNMTAETTLALAHEVGNIAAIKEASGNLPQMMRIIKERPANFSVISGDDVLSLPLIASGGQGVISVAANAFPREMGTIIRNSLNLNFTESQTAHYEMFDLFESFFAEGSPSGIKAALHILGLCENVLRLPLVPVSQKLYDKIKSLIQLRTAQPSTQSITN